MDQKDLPALLVKCTVLSLKYANCWPLFEALFPGHYADWAMVDRVLSANNTLGDAEAWLCLIGLVEWPGQGLIYKDSVDIKTNHASLAKIKAALKTHNLHFPGRITACSVLRLQLINGLQSMHAIGLLTVTSSMLARNTRESTMELLAGPSTYPRPTSKPSRPLAPAHCQLRARPRSQHRLNLRLRSMQMVALH